MFRPLFIWIRLALASWRVTVTANTPNRRFQSMVGSFNSSTVDRYAFRQPHTMKKIRSTCYYRLNNNAIWGETGEECLRHGESAAMSRAAAAVTHVY